MTNVFGFVLPPIYKTVAMWGYVVSGSIGLIISIITIALGVNFNTLLANQSKQVLDSAFLSKCTNTPAGSLGCFTMSAGIFFSVLGELYSIAIGVITYL